MKRRCDCPAYYGFRLAVRMLVIGLVAIAAIGAFLHAAEPKPLLIDSTPAEAGR